MSLGTMNLVKIKTQRKWTLEEILEILKAEGNLQSEPYLLDSGIMKGLYVRGIGKYDINISTLGKTITCSEIIRYGEKITCLRLGSLTHGWNDILDKDAKKNMEMTKAVGEEVERLFAHRQ